MITIHLRRRVAAAALSLAAVFATTAATVPTHTPARVAAAPACPVVADPAMAAVDQRVDISRITPDPVWRTTCGTLYRSDSRGPAIVFDQGFAPKDVVNGQYDIEKYVLVNQPSPYVSTTYDHDLYKTWYKSGYNYYIDAPAGVDVNKTIGDIQRQYIIGVCPVDKKTKVEIMSDCESNPNYRPWH